MSKEIRKLMHEQQKLINKLCVELINVRKIKLKI